MNAGKDIQRILHIEKENKCCQENMGTKKSNQMNK
jgi:hypothetical protein